MGHIDSREMTVMGHIDGIGMLVMGHVDSRWGRMVM